MEQGPDSKRTQEVGPSPPPSLGPPKRQMWVMEVPLRATCTQCMDLILCKDIWGFSQHQGGSDGQGRLRDLFTRVRAHDSTALTQGFKMQGSCMSHTCVMSAVCRQHCICVPTSQALTQLWAWLWSWECSVQDTEYQGQDTVWEVSVSG